MREIIANLYKIKQEEEESKYKKENMMKCSTKNKNKEYDEV